VTLGISAGAKFFSFFVIEYRTTSYLSLYSVIKKKNHWGKAAEIKDY
jgi:hypothetical protein